MIKKVIFLLSLIKMEVYQQKQVLLGDNNFEKQILDGNNYLVIFCDFK